MWCLNSHHIFTNEDSLRSSSLLITFTKVINNEDSLRSSSWSFSFLLHSIQSKEKRPAAALRRFNLPQKIKRRKAAAVRCWRGQPPTACGQTATLWLFVLVTALQGCLQAKAAKAATTKVVAALLPNRLLAVDRANKRIRIFKLIYNRKRNKQTKTVCVLVWFVLMLL